MCYQVFILLGDKNMKALMQKQLEVYNGLCERIIESIGGDTTIDIDSIRRLAATLIPIAGDIKRCIEEYDKGENK